MKSQKKIKKEEMSNSVNFMIIVKRVLACYDFQIGEKRKARRRRE